MATEAPTGSGTSAEPPAAIELRDVVKEFRLESGQTITAIDHATLVVPPGEFVCVLGPSGHGKSTMLNAIAGFIEPTSGTVRAAGKDITGPGRERGVVFQRDTLFLWRRVADNIAFGLKARGVPKQERDKAVEHYLKLIGLEDYGRAWPKQLSGGMRRRVAIAAVFANEPEVLLMDEPFVGLDYARRAVLHSVLLELWNNSHCTVFFITHDVDEALALADRIIVVVRGSVCHEERLTMARPRSVADLGSDEANSVRTRLFEHMDLGTDV
ncbi:MAG: sulfonate transport system ATP-binding protein [Solirubrobacteraceae bacterium]|nr:sulfonate transport system ATP-binding protein [Solirubrobacteraceae bacterium]